MLPAPRLKPFHDPHGFNLKPAWPGRPPGWPLSLAVPSVRWRRTALSAPKSRSRCSRRTVPTLTSGPSTASLPRSVRIQTGAGRILKLYPSCRQNSCPPMCAREICDYEPACGIQTPVPSTFRSRAECKHFFPGAVRACQALEEHTPRYASQPRGFSQWRPLSKQKLCPGVGLAERRCERRTLAWVWPNDAVKDVL